MLSSPFATPASRWLYRLGGLALLIHLLGAASARAETIDVELAKGRFATGRLLYQGGRYAEALTEFEAARADLHKPEFDYNIGLCWAQLDRPDEAAAAYTRYLAARPDDPEAPRIRQMIIELEGEVARRRAHRPKPAPPALPD